MNSSSEDAVSISQMTNLYAGLHPFKSINMPVAQIRGTQDPKMVACVVSISCVRVTYLASTPIFS